MSSRRVVAGLAVVIGCTAGCASMPNSGVVHLGRAFPATGQFDDTDVRLLPPEALPGLSPTALVSGFLRALVNDDDNYLTARTYLTDNAGSSWDTNAGISIYDDTRLAVADVTGHGSTRVVRVTAPRIGTVDRRGDYTARPGEAAVSFTLVEKSGQWRIDKLPPGVLLSQIDAQRSLRPALVYYLSPGAETLVPEQVLLQPSERGVATALLRALLSGPGSSIAPAVRTAVPLGTELIGNVPVDAAGVAQVNLTTAVRQATTTGLQSLSAQIVWTLRQLPEVTAVRLFADGSPLSVAGVPSRQPMTAWPVYDPDDPPNLPTAAYVAGSRLHAIGPARIPGLAQSDPGSDNSVALSGDGLSIAVVRTNARGETLLVGSLGQPLRSVITAASLTAPTFDHSNDAFTIADRPTGRFLAIVPPGRPARAFPLDATLRNQPVQAVRLSRDGARVAAVVGALGHGQLYVGRVVKAAGGVSFGEFHNVLPEYADIRGVAWQSAVSVVTTASVDTGRDVVEVDVDGYANRTLAADTLGDPPIGVAASPGEPLVVATATEIWMDEDGRWSAVAHGQAPVYAD